MANKKINDEVLVHRLQDGDEEAFNQLYERYHRLVYHIAFQMTNCIADAEEVKQGTFLQVLRYIHSIKEAKTFKYWLVTITHNQCKRLFRQNKDQGMDEEMMDALAKSLESRHEFLPEKNMRYESDMNVLYHCLSNLNEEHREVLSLKYFAQLSINEISDILKIPTGTVKSRMSYAKKQLKAEVETYCHQEGVPITFRVSQIGTMMAAAVGMHTWRPISLLKRLTSSGSSTSIIVAKASMVLALLGGSGFAIYNATKPKEPTLLNNTFQSVQYEGKQINNAREAYIELKQWAHCDVDVREKTAEELDAIRALYTSFKAEGNSYFDLLQQSWKNEFEKIGK